MWGQIIGAGASLIGGMMGSDASDRASQAQQRATEAAIAEQRRQYDQTRTDQAPWRDAGGSAVNRLKYLLGLGGSGSATDRAALRANLLPNYTKQVTGPVGSQMVDFDGRYYYPEPTTTTSVDEAGLNAAIDAQTANPNDPEYGSLMRNFTMADRDADPVYQSGLQFGLDQGKGAINERAIANGGYDSGATLKALTRFGNDYGSTKAGGAYDRFNINNANKYNRLAGVSGMGQTAANATGAAGQSSTNAISELLTGGGNAQAAGIVGGANAYNNAFGGIGSAINGYQNRNMMERILGGRNSGSAGNGGYSYGGGNAFETGIDYSGMY